MSRLKWSRKLNRENKGSSMVEVLVAVLVVMIMMAVMSTAMTTVMNIWNRSSQRLQENIALDTEYYKIHTPGDSRVTVETVGFTLSLLDADGAPTSTKIDISDVELESFRMEDGTGARFNLKKN